MRRPQRALVSVVLLIVFSLLYLAFKFPDLQTEKGLIFSKIIDRVFSYVPSVILTIIIFIFTTLVIQTSTHFISRYFEKRGKKEEDIFLILIVYKYLVWFLALMIGLSTIFKNFGSLLTSLGLIGFGITFALQKPILNFVGWLSIITNVPYKIGDRIRINNVKGDVFNVKVMYTYLREVDMDDSFTGRVVSVPNEFVLTYETVNYTKGSPYVWEEFTYGVTYESDWKKAAEIISKCADEVFGKEMKELAKEFKDVQRKFDVGTAISEKPSIRVSLMPSSVDIRIRVLLNIRKKSELKTNINEVVLERLLKTKNINIAYPHTHIILDKATKNNI